MIVVYPADENVVFDICTIYTNDNIYPLICVFVSLKSKTDRENGNEKTKQKNDAVHEGNCSKCFHFRKNYSSLFINHHFLTNPQRILPALTSNGIQSLNVNPGMTLPEFARK